VSLTPLIVERDSLQGLLEQEMQAFFHRQKERYEFGDLFEPVFFDMCEFVGRKGKRIRPLLFLLTYRALGGKKGWADKSLIQAALSLELLHAFVLVHDDLIDRSEKRRGLPTFHKLVEQRQGRMSHAERTGQGVALVVGDLLFALSVETLQQSDFEPAPRQQALAKLLSYVTDTGVGEIFDILLGSRDIGRVTRDEIELTYLLKTTRYTFEAPCVIGALLAGASSEKADDLARVMEPLGLAFQIQNDLLEISHLDGKDQLLPTDLLEGKKTLLMLEAYQRLGEVDRSFLQMCFHSAARNEASISKVQDLLRKSGAIQAMQERCRSLFEQANQVLAQSHLTEAEQASIAEAIAWVRQTVRLGS
jgi:geranylgeranyl diphosphate synthase type I